MIQPVGTAQAERDEVEFINAQKTSSRTSIFSFQLFYISLSFFPPLWGIASSVFHPTLPARGEEGLGPPLDQSEEKWLSFVETVYWDVAGFDVSPLPLIAGLSGLQAAIAQASQRQEPSMTR